MRSPRFLILFWHLIANGPCCDTRARKGHGGRYTSACVKQLHNERQSGANPTAESVDLFPPDVVRNTWVGLRLIRACAV